MPNLESVPAVDSSPIADTDILIRHNFDLEPDGDCDNASGDDLNDTGEMDIDEDEEENTNSEWEIMDEMVKLAQNEESYLEKV